MKRTAQSFDKLLDSFNKPDTHLVISRWPSKSGKYDGIATYTKDIVAKLSENKDARFVVLAEMVGNKKELEKASENVLIIRAFDDKKFHLYPQVLRWLNRFSKIKNVYVHSEFCASGGPILRFLVIPFLTLIRMTGRQITFYAHNVVKNLSGYEDHLGFSNGGWEMKLMGFGYRWYFRLLSRLVKRFVVLEDVVAERLKSIVGSREVLVEPHWIESTKVKFTNKQAKKKLGLNPSSKLVVSFGFVTHYKGADFVANTAKWMSERDEYSDVIMALAGGKAYSLENKEYYEKYYSEVENMSVKYSNLMLTGFLKESEVDLWLTAADVVILPYRKLMGGSGALQKALSYKKPILVSEKMSKNLGMNNSLMAYKHDPLSLGSKIQNFFEDSKYQRKVRSYCDEYSKNIMISKLLPKHYSDVYDHGSYPKKSFFKPTIKWLVK